MKISQNIPCLYAGVCAIPIYLSYLLCVCKYPVITGMNAKDIVCGKRDNCAFKYFIRWISLLWNRDTHTVGQWQIPLLNVPANRGLYACPNYNVHVLHVLIAVPSCSCLFWPQYYIDCKCHFTQQDLFVSQCDQIASTYVSVFHPLSILHRDVSSTYMYIKTKCL